MFAVLQIRPLAVFFSLMFVVSAAPMWGLAESPVLQLAQAETQPAHGEPNGDPKSSAPQGRLQVADDEAPPAEPVKQRSDEKQAQLDGMAWYMTGLLLESRNEFKQAYDAYRRAVEQDPNASAVYQKLVPLAFNLGQTEVALQYALKAVQLDPDDFQLLRVLGVHMAGQNKFKEAVEYLDKARSSSRLEKNSGVYVLLLRDLGVLYGLMGEIDRAADCFEVVFDALVHREKYSLDFQTRARLLSDDAADYEKIGQLFLEAKRPKLAIQAFEQATKSRKGNSGTLSYNLATAYLQLEEGQKALDELQQYFDAQLQSKGKAAYRLLADVLKQMDMSDELIPRLEKLAEKDSRNSTLQFFLASQYRAADRIDDAEKLYRQVLSGADEFEGHIGLVAVHRLRGQAADLLESLVKALRSVAKDEGQESQADFQAELDLITEDEELSKAMIEVGQTWLKDESNKLTAEAAYLVAKIATETDQAEPAVEFSLTAFKTGRVPTAEMYLELGQNLMQFQKYAEAGDVYEQAADKAAFASQKPNFLFQLSRVRELDGQTERALEAIGEAREIIPDHPLLKYQEGWVYYHSRQWDKAIPVFEDVIANYPQPEFKNPVRLSQFSLSNIYVQKGDMQKGEAILEKVLAEEPDDPSVNNDLGYLWADQGKNLERAETMIRKAIEAEPENVAYLDSMGWVLYKLGRYEEGLPYLEKATSLGSGGDATIWDHLGDCYARLDQPEKAKEAWETALKHAKEDKHPDEKLIKTIEEKLAGSSGPAASINDEKDEKGEKDENDSP